MEKVIALLILFLFNSFLSVGQEFRNDFIVKTNVFTWPFVPSLHLENQILPKSSLQLNFHYAKFTFISPEELLNVSLDFRRYFTKNEEDLMKGFYVSGGVNVHHNFLKAQVSDSGNFISQGITSIGPSIRFGYQLQKNRFVFDVGSGGFLYLHYFQKSPNNTQAAQLWLNASIGLRLN
jgi:Protein of unknown function (DUF3575)